MTIDHYLTKVPPHRGAKMLAIMQLIRSLYPEVKESMRFKMPTYEHNEGWVAVANQKHYLSLYTCSAEHLLDFKVRHPKIKTGKGCINFKDKDELPLEDLALVINSAMSATHK